LAFPWDGQGGKFTPAYTAPTIELVPLAQNWANPPPLIEIKPLSTDLIADSVYGARLAFKLKCLRPDFDHPACAHMQYTSGKSCNLIVTYRNNKWNLATYPIAVRTLKEAVTKRTNRF
jgi:hypothetical protein